MVTLLLSHLTLAIKEDQMNHLTQLTILNDECSKIERTGWGWWVQG